MIMVSPLIELIQENNWGEYQGIFDALQAWKYWDIFEKALNELLRGALFVSPVHGEGHIERTMLYGAVAAMENGLSEEDTRILLTMCSYHDTGRMSDWLDDAHGQRSAYKLAGITGFGGDTLAMMMAGVEAHSRRDDHTEEIIKSYCVKDHDRTLMLTRHLKDSDGLDRVRISDLDVKYLRNEKAKTHADFAKYVFDVYTKKQEQLGISTAKKIDYFHSELVKSVRDNIHKMLEEDKCAYEIVFSNLCMLKDRQFQMPDVISCVHGGEQNLCGTYLAANDFITMYGGDNDEYKSRFFNQYKLTRCIEIRPAGLEKIVPKTMCGAMMLDVTLFTYEFLSNK